MKIRVKGDFRELDRFISKIKTTPDVLKVISENLAEETIELIRHGFEREQDPSGKRWAPLKYRSGKILQDSGRLRASWKRATTNKRGFTVSASVKYASYHQTGTSRGLPARKMVPEGKLPPEWLEAYKELVEEILSEHFK